MTGSKLSPWRRRCRRRGAVAAFFSPPPPLPSLRRRRCLLDVPAAATLSPSLLPSHCCHLPCRPCLGAAAATPPLHLHPHTARSVLRSCQVVLHPFPPYAGIWWRSPCWRWDQPCNRRHAVCASAGTLGWGSAHGWRPTQKEGGKNIIFCLWLSTFLPPRYCHRHLLTDVMQIYA